ncbi:MAG: NUDIX hydrolase [Oscillospiraceae bacterium]|nr:NUDIX hydrolase [Oscillospiraceae bacterium]
MAHTEKTINEETIFTGRIFTVKRKHVELENGHTRQREVVLHNGGAAVLPVDDDGNVYLIRQFRSPFEQEVLEIPAGKLEKGEDPFEAAKRELSEETGFTAKHYFDLGQVWPTVGFCSEILYIWMATGLTRGETHFDEDEFVTTVKMPLEDAWNMCMDGTIKDSKTLVAIMKAREILGK